jgi:type II secretory pathway pseudopilin PulG
MNGGSAKSRKTAGFTIVEVMIVMAVTGALFVSVALTMSGKQRKAEFFQATNDIHAVVQQTINEVSAGFYPSKDDFRCVQTAGPAITIMSAAGQRGTNQSCVFLGKVMYFGQNPLGDQETFNTFSIAGLRSATTLASAAPTVVQNGVVDTTASAFLKYGLSVRSVKYNDVVGDAAANDVSIGAVAFMTAAGETDTAGNYKSGSQRVDLVPVPGTALNRTKANMITDINTYLKTASVVNPRNGVKICFVGADNLTALITIGSNGHDLLAKLEVKDCT